MAIRLIMRVASVTLAIGAVALLAFHVVHTFPLLVGQRQQPDPYAEAYAECERNNDYACNNVISQLRMADAASAQTKALQWEVVLLFITAVLATLAVIEASKAARYTRNMLESDRAWVVVNPTVEYTALKDEADNKATAVTFLIENTGKTPAFRVRAAAAEGTKKPTVADFAKGWDFLAEAPPSILAPGHAYRVHMEPIPSADLEKIASGESERFLAIKFSYVTLYGETYTYEGTMKLTVEITSFSPDGQTASKIGFEDANVGSGFVGPSKA